MNKTEKFLNKISLFDKEKILMIVDSIIANDLNFSDLKKIQGSDNIYRVRVEKFQIKFIKQQKFNEIIEIGKRNDNTY
ncbi:hypothetical protein HY061_03500 [Candidatus Azambacteria bacterium]|nr:hypothetical protein [Candidatus Azambacteria bacterium]